MEKEQKNRGEEEIHGGAESGADTVGCFLPYVLRTMLSSGLRSPHTFEKLSSDDCGLESAFGRPMVTVTITIHRHRHLRCNVCRWMGLRASGTRDMPAGNWLLEGHVLR
jgi:hypothetical protein